MKGLFLLNILNVYTFIIKNKSLKDLLLVILITLIYSYILIQNDAFEIFAEFLREYEEYELDEFLLIIPVLTCSLLWYLYRRFQEIRLIENHNKKLNNENIKKDKLLLEQMKMASLGEMLDNIAHQWRQPLSTISTSASGITVKKEFGILSDQDLDTSLDVIMTNIEYLSHTIDDFRNFVKNEKSKIIFNLNKIIEYTLNIEKGSLKISNIIVIMSLDKNIKMKGYPNELTQVLMNIINNSKEAFIDKNIEEKYIFISTKITNNKIQINIKDNALGISTSILPRIFEPYITSKHNSKGTGLGLFMSYKIIIERFNGLLYAQNTTFIYKEREYTGAEFIIEISI